MEMINSTEDTGSAEGRQATNIRDTGLSNFPHRKANPSHTSHHAVTERKAHTALTEEEPDISKKSENFVSDDSDSDEYPSDCKKSKFSVNLENESECSSENVSKSSVTNYMKDDILMVSEDEESYENKAPVQHTEIIYDLTDIDSELMFCIESASIPIVRAHSTENTLESQNNETKEAIIKRIEQVLVSEGLVPNGRVNWKSVAEETTDEETDGLAVGELEDLFLNKICQIYFFHKEVASFHLKHQKLEKMMGMWEEEFSEHMNGTRRLKKLIGDYQLELEAIEANKSEQQIQESAIGVLGKSSENNEILTKPVCSTKPLVSQEEENQVRDKHSGMLPTQEQMCPYHRSLAISIKESAISVLGKSGEDTPVLPKPLVSQEQNQVKEKQSGMIPTQVSLCLYHEALVIKTEESAISVLGKSGKDTPLLPKPEISTEQLASQKEQNQSISKIINTTSQTGQVKSKNDCVHDAKSCFEVVDLTLDNYLQFADSATGTSSVTKDTTTKSKTVSTSTILAPNLPVGMHERQIQESVTSAKLTPANPAKIQAEPGASSSDTTSYSC